jgi:hypothetical protein
MNKLQYYRHKEKPEVVCDVFKGLARFSRWSWKGDTCSEGYTHKEVTEDFKRAFEEITQAHFNDVWGDKLQSA